MKYLEQVIRAIQDSQIGDNLGELTGSTTIEQLGWDSLDISEVIMELEEEFDVSITDASLEKIVTVNDLAAVIEGLKGGN